MLSKYCRNMSVEHAVHVGREHVRLHDSVHLKNVYMRDTWIALPGAA